MLNRFTAHRTKPFTIFLLAIGLMGLVGLAALLLNLEFISPKGSLFQVPSFDNIPTEELNVIETGPSTRTAFFCLGYHLGVGLDDIGRGHPPSKKVS